ncbi:MAG: thioredoxin domain-containing protein, partial [Ignavibacteriales bacterium]|nr:thioredoxin domain-containing protein [Ignavibacteriales bacterium]
CYWCHVMDREVFENDSIAGLMNEYVVSIKVDREERPDVDRVYMAALAGMTGSGGWPMSMFLTPDLKPFFGATYIPPVQKYGRAGFPDILTRIHEIWVTDRRQILEYGERVRGYLEQASAVDTDRTKPTALALERGFDSFSRSYDTTHAGFGGAPKFPRPVAFNFLLRYYSKSGEKAALEMNLETLRRMYHGGMYDHLGGGFHRYSTDATWQVPHFEKMLYDQAQLAVSYLEAYQITHEDFYSNVVRDVLRYVDREMTHPDGPFYSAQDAESALDPMNPDSKKEGAFYTWTKTEIDATLSPMESRVFDERFGVQTDGNARVDPHGEFKGLNILHIARTSEEVASRLNLSKRKVEELITSSKKKLFERRAMRPLPHLDDKVLVSWNGLMVSAFARAHQVLGNDSYLQSAERAAAFILDKMYDERGKTLVRRYRDGEAKYEGHLEDYAFFTQGLIDLYEASLDIRWLQRALELTERQIELFVDDRGGGFYDISGSDKSILVRTKESYDGAEPSGNSIAILNLLRLAEMTDSDRYRELASRSLLYFGERMLTTPQGLAQFLVALDFSLSKPKQIIIAGKADDPHTARLLKEVHTRFMPNKIILLADGGKGQETLASYIPFLRSVSMQGGQSTAYICENYACKLPTSDVGTVAQILDGEITPQGRILR